MRSIAELYKQGVWLQIGSNTMDLNPTTNSPGAADPLAQHLVLFPEWDKIFVEPIPENFRQLVNNTRTLPHSKPLQLAILGEPGVESNVTLYCFPEEQFFLEWRQGSCSLSKDKIEGEMGAELMAKHAPQAFNVTAISVEALLERYVADLSRLQVVLIDVEGFDANVVRQLPFGTPSFRPKLIVWENMWLSAEVSESLKTLLHEHCYMVIPEAENTYAIPAIDLTIRA